MRRLWPVCRDPISRDPRTHDGARLPVRCTGLACAALAGVLAGLAPSAANAQAANAAPAKPAPQQNWTTTLWRFITGQKTLRSDGFSITVTGHYQLDEKQFDQSLNSPQATRLRDGFFIRGAYLGVRGTVFGDWDYRFNYDFPGNDPNGVAHVKNAFVQYNGFAPFHIRVGGFSPPFSIGGDTGSPRGELASRPTPVTVTRNVAAGAGRQAATLFYSGPRLFAALSYSQDKIYNTISLGRQWALLSRISVLAYTDADWRVVVGTGGTYVVRPSETHAGAPGSSGVTLSDFPELVAAQAKLSSTGLIEASHLYQAHVEGAVQRRNLFGEAGYYANRVVRRPGTYTPGGAHLLDFSGWYVEGGWILTGERRSYFSTNMTFAPPEPKAPVPDGWGAWEIAARYSDMNLNFDAGRPGLPTPPGGVRGGRQRIVSLALNWYPTDKLRFIVQYEDIGLNRLSAEGIDIGQHTTVTFLRAQLYL